MTRHPHRRTTTGAPRLIRRALVTGALTVAGTASLGLAAGPASAATTAQIDNGVLQISGDAASDQLALVNQPATFVLDVGEDGTADFTFDRSTFTAIELRTRGGDDRVDVVNAGGAFDKAITVDGGAGDDTLRGGAGAETLIGGAGDDDIDGNIGADTIDGGTGSDRIQWDPGDGSDTVEGGGGNDALDFNGSNANERIDITANGSRVRLVRDVASIDMDLDGLEQLRLRALGGTDTVTVDDLEGTGVKTVSTDLRSSTGDADGAVDHVIARGTDAADRFAVGNAEGDVLVSGPGAGVRVKAADAQDSVDVQTLGDADTVTSGVDVPGPGQVTVDGGDGADTSIYKGTDGDDTIGIARNGDAAAVFVPGGGTVNHTAVESLDVRGLGGDDTIAGQNGIASTGTQVTLEGGDGADTLLGTDGADTLLGGPGDDLVDGNIGADTARLGGGDDHFRWDPGDGSDVVEGQAGADTLDFNASNAAEQIDVSANGPRVRLFRNVGAVTMDFDGIEAMALRALGGSDQITVGDLAGTELKAAGIDLSAVGGGGDGAQDTVTVNGRDRADHVAVTRSGDSAVVGGLPATTTISGSELVNDTLRVNTLGGKDDVTVDPNAEPLITPVIDLGADQ